MHIRNIVFGIILSLYSAMAVSGEGHDHSKSTEAVNAKQAVSIASRNVNRLADAGKIDKSWKTIKAKKAERKEFNGTKEWVVVFENTQIADASKKKMYVFLTLEGDYLATNYTGK
jgi:hypothetical protein